MLLKFTISFGKTFVGKIKSAGVNTVVGSHKRRASEVVGHRRLDLKTVKLSWNNPFRKIHFIRNGLWRRGRCAEL